MYNTPRSLVSVYLRLYLSIHNTPRSLVSVYLRLYLSILYTNRSLVRVYLRMYLSIHCTPRSPDGESGGYPLGQMSIQQAASTVLDRYIYIHIQQAGCFKIHFNIQQH